jgi:hypothetical protein
MQLVVFRQGGSIIDGDCSLPVVAPPDRQKLQPEHIYAVCDNFYRFNQNLMEPVGSSGVQMPRAIEPGNLDEVKAFQEGVVKVLVVNGFGSGYGDLLAGSVALERLHAFIRGLGKEPVIDLLIREGRWHRYCEVFKLNPFLHRIIPAVMPLPDLLEYDFAVSTEHFLFDPEFGTRNCHDYFLQRLGLDPEVEEKRLRLYPNPQVLNETAQIAASVRSRHPGERFLLLNFFASAVRSIPSFVWRPLLEVLSDRYTVVLVSAEENRRALHKFARNLPPSQRNRVVDLARVSSRSFDHLIGLVQHLADAVVTPDTSVLHVCGGLDTPCVGIFFTIEPELRIRHYPTVRAYCPDFFRSSSFWGESRLGGEQNRTLESHPEFVALWKRADLGVVRSLVDQVAQLESPEANLPKSVYVHTGKAPRALVFAGTGHLGLADRFHYHLISSVLPPDCEIQWAPLHPVGFRSLAAWDLVLLGTGGLIDANALQQPGLADLVEAARRRVGLFGLGARGAVPAPWVAPWVERLDLWFARTRQDLERHGQNRGNAHHLGEWLMTLIPVSRWDTNDELTVVENRFVGSLDDFVKQVQLFRKVRASGPVTLASALLSAEAICWEEDPKAPRVAPLRTLLEDVFHRAPREGDWFDVPREEVLAYRRLLRDNVAALRNEIQALLDS